MPLMSLTASGQIGNGTLQFRSTRHGAQALLPTLARPRNRASVTTAQETTRADFASFARDWAGLGPVGRDLWDAESRRRHTASGWNSYLAYRMSARAPDPAVLRMADGSAIVDAAGRTLRI